MINTYAYVSENHQEWDVLHKIVPSYLKALTGKETNNVVFVHKLVIFDDFFCSSNLQKYN